MATTVQETLSPGSAIPTPAHFALQWQQPVDAKLFWEFDIMHFPNPIKPLFEQFLIDMNQHGFNVIAEKLELPMRRRTMIVNGYLYNAFIPASLDKELAPLLELDNGASSSNAQRMVALPAETEPPHIHKLTQAVAQLEADWTQEWLPEVQRYINACEAFDLRQAAWPGLLTQLDFAVQGQKRVTEFHIEIAVTLTMAISQFDELYQELFPGADKFAAFQLLQGVMNKSLEADHALWRLSRRALALSPVRQVFDTAPDHAVLEGLRQSAEGCEFLRDWDAFLTEYGKRSDSFDTYSDPSWLEDPTPALKNIRDYLNQPDRDLEAEQQLVAAQAEKALETTRSQLNRYPQAIREQFEQSLKTAQFASRLQEDHNYWIDQRAAWQIRALFLEFGQRFAAAGVVDEPLDVLFLTFPEFQATAQQFPHLKRQTLLEVRKAECAHFSKLKPPPMLGTLPAFPPPSDSFALSAQKFFGFDAPAPSLTGNELHGLSGSPGKVRGIARVALSLAEARKLHKGDILVTRTTAPPWTPLFATAAAVVTEAGGILSHCAIVAREYCIPAVLGVRNATQRLADGMLIEVDGDAGTVRILE